jgi:hypothetical protein
MTRKRNRLSITEYSLKAPNLIDPPEEKADWAECWTLVSKDGNTSFSEIRAVMKIGGSADAHFEFDEFDYAEVEGSNDKDAGTENTNLYEAAAEDTFLEISDRIEACGEPAYPFDVTAENIAMRDDSSTSTYTFLLLLSEYGPNAGSKKNEGAKLFEDICAHAVMTFLGGKKDLAEAQVFGFPRRVTHNSFSDALDVLCNNLMEGEGCKNRPKTLDQKDAKLDVVGWKSFRDQRMGRLIIFGQCATGSDWRSKRSELIAPLDWCSYWMKDRPAVWPMRAFFVPHRIGLRDWLDTCVHGGLLFDRCRLASYTTELPKETTDEMVAWTKCVMEQNREG